MSHKKKPVVLVDGSSYLYRAFYAMPNLTNSKGEPTGAIYGVVNMVRSLIADQSPDHLAVVFDAKGKTFRNDLYKEYKAHRPPMPEEMKSQISILYEVIRAMGVPLLFIEGVEADDVIGTLAKQAQQHGFETLVSTGDKDLAQIVNADIKLIDTMKGVVYDEQGVQQKFGVPPDLIIDYLSLIGDTSDNVPGVPKVGPKTAVKWLSQYGSLDKIIANANEIGGKVGENLRSSLDQLALSRELVTLKLDVPLELGLEDLLVKQPDKETLRSLFSSLEFKTWLSELGGIDGEKQAEKTQSSYTAILNEKQLDSWLKRLNRAKLFALDTETTSLDAIDAQLVGISFTDAVGEGAYVPLTHDYMGAPTQLNLEAVLTKLKPLLEDSKRHKVGQNLKYDASVLANYSIELKGIQFDTMLESYVLNSTAARHDMDSLALKYLGKKTIKFEDVAGKGKNQLSFNQVQLEEAVPYAAEDADITLQLHQSLWPKLKKEPKLKSLFEDIEMPLLGVLSRIERNGVKVDVDMLRIQSGELTKRLEETQKEIYLVAGTEFNVASPKQIQEVLYDRLNLPVLRKTPTGQPSTAENVLQDLAVDYDLPRLILEFRGLSKLKSTYTDKLPLQVSAKTGRVHTSYHQAVAATGRLSSTDPNLQNIPIRTTEGKRIREAFVTESGYRMLSVDYSQIELRIMAHLSADEGLMQAFSEGKDIHRATAAEVFGVSVADVSGDQRRHAKAINFGLIYGMSAFGLARQLHIERGQAQEYVDLYFSRYPGVKAFMDNTREAARKTGYVETVFGRRLYLPEINSGNHNRRQYAERTAINAPMQGTAADLIKMAMLSVDAWLHEQNIDAKIIMQVHDELVFEVKASSLEVVKQQAMKLMTEAATFSVPLEVDAGVGDNWAQAHG